MFVNLVIRSKTLFDDASYLRKFFRSSLNQHSQYAIVTINSKHCKPYRVLGQMVISQNIIIGKKNQSEFAR